MSGAGSRGGSSAAIHLGEPALAAASMPRGSTRVAVIMLAALAGLLLALLIVRVTFGASEAAQTARELAVARDAIAQRDAQIASLQGSITSTTAQAQSELQNAAKTAQTAQDRTTAVASERDEAKQRVSQLETKLMESQTRITDLEGTTTQQAQQLKSLASCLNGTAVGLAFGRTNRWPSAEFALAAVADACKASESLLQQR